MASNSSKSTPNTLQANEVILGERNYELALDTIISKANQKLLIFDQDLKQGDFKSEARFQLVHDFLIRNASSQLTIVLQYADFFKTDCPRLFSLLETYGHKMEVFETNKSAKVAKDCFVLADDAHYIRRFHIDQARFKYNLDDIEMTASLQKRFDEIMQEVADKISVIKLGL